MAESPTSTQVLTERPDLQDYIEGNNANLDIDAYIAKALAQVKRDIEDKRGIKWTMVYNSVTLDYFVNTDGEAKNKDRLHNAIILLTVAKVFQDYAIRRTDGAAWSEMYLAYRSDYDMAIADMKLDVDRDESGAISECEENSTTQVFMGR